MYCQIRNDEKLLFDSLPFRVTLADGTTRTSLSELSAAQLAEIGVYPVVGNQPEHDPSTQRLVGPTLVLDGDHVTATWTVESLSAEEIAAILAGAKSAKKDEIAAAFDTHIAGSVMVTLGYPLQFNTRDTIMVRGAIELAQATEQTSLYLTDANDVTHEGVSIAEAQATLIEMMAAFAQAHAKKQTLRAQIDAAQTVEDVEAVTW